jgi:peptidyl-prolyl cis-trans isomerase D
MIEWMQKHKKWLIVTIWISTIAFVGAGFVGWGSYDYGKSTSAVAIVGKKEVPLKDLQNEYNSLYSQYQQMLGDNFNNELAKQFKLEEAALQRVTQKYLILNYADELGLMTTDKEIAQQLVEINSFYKDGKFDKDTYKTVLKQNKRTTTEFEAQLKQDILITKVQDLFQTSLKTNELKNISSLIFSEDEVSINIIDDKNIKVTISEEKLKNYWSKNKENYKSESGFKILYTKIENIENKTKKEMRKVALKEYLSLKKGKSQFKEIKTIYTSSEFLEAKDLKTVTNSKEGTVLKPLYKDNNYYVIKAEKKVLPEELPYEEVKAQITTDYTRVEKASLLNEKANKIVTDFIGKNIGFISRSNIPNIDGLSEVERDEFIKSLFASTQTINTVNLGSKMVIYKIVNSKFKEYDSTQDQTVIQTIGNLKNSSLTASFLEKLAMKYEIKSFVGNN